MSITYEANLNCDGKDCKTRPITAFHEDPEYAKRYALQKSEREDWVIILDGEGSDIDDEHYCPDCAEIVKPDLKVIKMPSWIVWN